VKEMNFGDRLKKLRQERGLTQEEFGKKINVTKVSVSGYETGNRNPDIQTLELIADYFEVPIDYLLGKTDEPVHYQKIIELVKKMDNPLKGVNLVSYLDNALTKEEKVKFIVNWAGEPGSEERKKIISLLEEFSKLPDSAQDTILDLIKQMQKKE
jgi:transcriptional regulator with XRE-family HTH domain